MRRKRRRIAGGILALCLMALIIGTAFYLGDYYQAEEEALELVMGQNTEQPEEEDASWQTAEQTGTAVEITEIKNKEIVFEPEVPTAGLIFYPGAKVQYEAYAPLMKQLADRGILCILLHMPGNLAILDQNAADDIKELYPEIERWYLCGHSLGGAMAASYAADHTEEYEGLILLAAYATKDLSDSNLQVLSLYGSEDGVLNRESYEKYRANLPGNYTEVVINGGCHAYFGSYGAQKGDGIPEISREEQMEQTADAVEILLMQGNQAETE